MKLVLIDRDGVINEDRPDAVKSVEELVIFPRALEAFALFARQGFTCAIVTNQSVVGRGIISSVTLDRIHNHLCDSVKSHGGHIDSLFVCTDPPDHATYRRKPKPGMLKEALAQYGVEASDTPFIGDALTDLEAAHAAHCIPYLVLTGKGEATSRRLPQELEHTVICRDILDAAHKIIDRWR
jgi:D-glycero-D-manno-heptose 1,7-bisphosphate phosphatase